MQTARQARTETSPASSAQRPSLFAITAAHSSVDMHTGSLAVLLPLLFSNLHLNYASAAAIITANNIVIAVAQPIFGILGDRKPNRALVWIGCLLTGLAMASVLWQPSYLTVLAAVIVSGIGSAMFHPEALARARAVMASRPATGVSVFFSGGSVGFALGPILATVLTQRLGAPGGLLMMIPTAAALAGLASQWRVISSIRNDAESATRSSSTANNYGLVGFLILLIAVRGTVSMGLQTFIPLFFHESGALKPEAAALLVTVLALSGVIGNLAGGTLADRYGRRVVMAGSLVITMVALFAFLHTDGLLRVLAIGVTGTFISAAWPIIVVMIQEAMPANLGLAGGLSLGTTYAAQGLGVAALGAFADVHGVASTMTLISLLPLVALALTAFVPERTPVLERART
jgi:FSR family fosmidomycin resistance protein-like MFS transporter